MAGVVRDANKRMERLIARLLALASSEAGVVPARGADLAESWPLRSTASARSTSAARCASTRRSTTAPVLGDPVLLERMAANLVENAVRYNSAIGWVRVWSGTERGEAVLRVANSGAKIAPDELVGVLEPFRRLESSRARVYGRLRARPGRRPRRGPGPRRPRHGPGPARGRPRGDGLAADGLRGHRRADRQHAGAGVVAPFCRGAAWQGAARRQQRCGPRHRQSSPLRRFYSRRFYGSSGRFPGVSRALRRDHLYVRRLLPLLVAAGISLGVAACGSDSGSSTRRRRRSPAPPTGSSTARRPARARRAVHLTVLAAGDVDYMDPGRDVLQFGFMVQYAVNRGLYSFRPGELGAPSPDLGDRAAPGRGQRAGTITVHLRATGCTTPRRSIARCAAQDVKYAVRAGLQRKRALELYATVYFGDIQGAPQDSARPAFRTSPGSAPRTTHTIVFHLTTARAPRW